MKTFILSILFLTGASFCFSQNIVQAEYFIDTDYGFGRNTVFNIAASPDATVPFPVNLAAVQPGYHKLYIRTKDSDGKWGITTRRNIEVLSSGGTIKITGGEYFFDSDPGFGNARPISISPQDSVVLKSFTAITDTLAIGYHKLYMRMKDSNGKWGITTRRNVEVVPAFVTKKVASGEYFFDVDNGFGSGNPIIISPQDSVVLQNFTAATDSLSTGYHKLYIRVKDSEGKWGLTSRRNAEIYKSFNPAINSAEYFFATDSGFGKASAVHFANPAADGSFTFNIPLNQIPIGAQRLCIRAKDSTNNNWGITQWQQDSVITSSGLDSVWSRPGTWSNGKVPDSNTVVILRHKVYVDITTAVCKSLVPYKSPAECIVQLGMKLAIIRRNQ